MTTKKLVFKALAYSAIIIALFFVARHLGHSIYHFGATTLVVLVVQCLAGYIACAISIAPVGTKPGISVLAVMLVFAAVCTITALIAGGFAAGLGAVVGTVCAMVYHRSVL